MSLFKNITNLVEKTEKAGEKDEKAEKADHDNQKSTIKSKTNPYMKGVPATADFGDLTPKDIHGMLDAAEEKDDGVETVTFGLETEEGDIVKVYVNVEDADKFEEALSQMLGKEDDIEKVLDELSNDYDIVDVKWPDSPEEMTDEVEDDGEETAAEKILGKKTNADEVTDEKDKKQPEVSEDNTMSNLGQSFLKRMLGEDKGLTKKEQSEKDAVKQKVIDDESNDKTNADPVSVVMAGDALVFEKELSNRYQRLGFQLSYLLGVPMSVLTLKRASYKRNLRTVAEKMIDNSQLRIWSKRLANELARAEISKTKDEINDVKEAKEPVTASSSLYETLQSRIQREIYKMFVELGVPEDAMNQRRSIMRSLIVQLGVTFQKKQRLRVIFRMMLAAFGISEAPETVVKESLELFEAEETTDQVDLLSGFTNATSYNAWLFLKIATDLGLPAKVLKQHISKFKLPLLNNLRGKTAAMSKLKAFAELMSIDTKMPLQRTAESINLEEKRSPDYDLDDSVDIDPDTEVTIKNASAHSSVKGEDLGEWNIASSGDKVTASIADKKIDLEEEQYEKIIGAMADGKPVSLLVNNARVSFRPEHHGKIYVVKWNENHPTYPDGVIMSEKSVKRFMDAGAK